jgi:hypothetical protein
MHRKAFIVSTTLALALSGRHVTAQGPELTRLRDLDPAAREEWRITAPVAPGEHYCVLDGRVAVLTADGRRIRLYGRGGGLLGQASSEVPLAGLVSSPVGRHLLGLASFNEDEQYAAVYDVDGRLLWNVRLGSTLGFSPSGEYLLTDFDALDASQRPVVYDAATGRVVWTDDSRRSYWQLAVSASGRLAHYRTGQLETFDLRTGALLWKADVPADPDHDLGSLWISRDGRAVAVETLDAFGGHEQRITQVFGAAGERMWERRVEGGDGAPGAVKALSDDGRLLAVEDAKALRFLGTTDGQEIARLEPRPKGVISVFREGLVAINLLSKTRVVLLGQHGIVGDYVLPDPLAFARPAATGASASIAASDRTLFPIAVRRVGGSLTASRSRFEPPDASAR